ncbi:MAG: hypothetical protein ACT4QF_12315 [Sporichthyaceae bacterium]
MVALAGLVASAGAAVEASEDVTLTGQASGLSLVSSGALTPLNAPGPDTGTIETNGAGNYDAPCATEVPIAVGTSQFGTARAVCAGFQTSPNVDAAIASASAGEVRFAVPALGDVVFTNVRSQSISKCDGAVGTASIGQVTAGGQTIPVVNLEPNGAMEFTTVGGGKVRFIFNEQVANAEQLTVNAARVIFTTGGAGQSSFTVASSTSGIRNCAAPLGLDAPAAS